jgi:MFS family permease
MQHCNLCIGLSFTFGILQENYESGPFKGQGAIVTVGTTASGFVYLSAPLTFWLFQYWNTGRRFWPVAGALLMVVAIIASSWCDTVPQLIVTQGLLYAMGCTLVYTPSIFYLDEWFDKRKGLAFGMMYAGTGLGGVILPFAFTATLSSFSVRTLLRGYGVIVCILLAVCLPYLRGRTPPGPRRQFDYSFLRSPMFLLFQLGNVIQSLGFFLPPLFLPNYLDSLDASPIMKTLSVVIFNLTSVVGCVALGVLIDRLRMTTCLAISTFGAAVSILALWGLARNVTMVLCFAAVYGLFAGAFSSTWPGIMRIVQQEWPNASGTMVFAFLAAGRGLGNIISGPISAYLILDHDGREGSPLGYDSKFMPMIIFTGISALLGGIGVIYKVHSRQSG